MRAKFKIWRRRCSCCKGLHNYYLNGRVYAKRTSRQQCVACAGGRSARYGTDTCARRPRRPRGLATRWRERSGAGVPWTRLLRLQGSRLHRLQGSRPHRPPESRPHRLPGAKHPRPRGTGPLRRRDNTGCPKGTREVKQNQILFVVMPYYSKYLQV